MVGLLTYRSRQFVRCVALKHRMLCAALLGQGKIQGC